MFFSERFWFYMAVNCRFVYKELLTDPRGFCQVGLIESGCLALERGRSGGLQVRFYNCICATFKRIEMLLSHVTAKRVIPVCTLCGYLFPFCDVIIV